MKRCAKCHRELLEAEFYLYRGRVGQYSARCRQCTREAVKAYQLEHAAEVRARVRVYSAKHKQLILARGRRYVATHQAEIKARNQRYYSKHCAELVARQTQYYQQLDPAVRAARQRQCYLQHQAARCEQTRLARVNWTPEQRENNRKTQRAVRARAYADPVKKAVKLFRYRVWKAVKEQSTKKSSLSLSLLGCTPTELRVHLERQWQPGMSWDTHGRYGWHIDHIVPLSSFDLADPVQQAKAFHYTNLQPLWWQDNLRKADSVTPLLSRSIAPAPPPGRGFSTAVEN